MCISAVSINHKIKELTAPTSCQFLDPAHVKLDPGVDAYSVPPGTAAAPVRHPHQHRHPLFGVKFVERTPRVTL